MIYIPGWDDEYYNSGSAMNPQGPQAGEVMVMRGERRRDGFSLLYGRRLARKPRVTR